MATKYYIEGISLKKWCLSHHYSYQSATKYIRSHPNYCTVELVKYLESLKQKERYFYNGITLRQYCVMNNLNYSKYLRRVENLLKSELLSDEEAVKKVVEEYVDSRCNFFYRGMSLKQYCDEHGYNYQKIYMRIKNIEDEEKRQRIIDDFMNDNPSYKRLHYNIDGLTLRKYCEKYNYIYPTMKTYIQNIRRDNPNISQDEVVKKAISYYKENHVSKEKFFYHGERLVDYCERNHYEYANVYGYLARFAKDTYNITDIELKKALYKYKIKLRKDAINSLSDKDNLEECIDILNILKINLNSVKLVMNFNLDFRRSILYVWYFGIENEGEITIDMEGVKNVFRNLNHLEALEINELIGYYKIGLFDTRNIIYDKTFLSVRKIVSNLCKEYQISNREFIDELKVAADGLLFDFIEKTTSRYLGQIINYMNTFIKGYLVQYILREFRENEYISLNDYRYRDSGNKQEKIGYISMKTEVDTEYFSEELLAILSSLSEIERQFIFLKYQEQYDDDKISQIMNIPLLEIGEFHAEILVKLGKRQDMKQLIKNK